MSRGRTRPKPRKRREGLSGGTTTAGVARELANHVDLTIVTNSLSIAGLVSTHPRLKVVMMAAASEVDVLITDDSADPAELDRLRAAGVEAVLA